jgi:hypothetical protein
VRSLDGFVKAAISCGVSVLRTYAIEYRQALMWTLEILDELNRDATPLS